MNSSCDIARQSRSNLAFALSALPTERRDDMIDFYAFCRVVDDIADDHDAAPEEKAAGLDVWRDAARDGFPGEEWLHADLRRIMERYQVPAELFLEIIDGVSRDIEPETYASLDDLLSYCYQVASAVGLVSIRIFGCGDDEDARLYAINLGYALQLTNIMRDVAEDLDGDGRIYLPTDLMKRFGYGEEKLRDKCYDPAFLELMEFLYQRAESYYEKAENHIRPSFRGRLVASEMMATIYRRILEKMRANHFRVFEQRYALSKLQKATIFASSWIRSKCSYPFPSDLPG